MAAIEVEKFLEERGRLSYFFPIACQIPSGTLRELPL
jgi:hypothetical protein